MAQFGRPNQTITDSDWTANGGPTELWDCVNEVSAVDTDYCRATGNQTMELKFSSVTDPQSSANHTIRLRARAIGSGGPERWTVTIYDGVVLIATPFSNASVTRDSFNDYSYTLTSLEADSIGSYSDLRVNIVTSQGASETIDVSWIEFEVPESAIGVTIQADPAPSSSEGVTSDILVITDISVQAETSSAHTSSVEAVVSAGSPVIIDADTAQSYIAGIDGVVSGAVSIVPDTAQAYSEGASASVITDASVLSDVCWASASGAEASVVVGIFVVSDVGATHVSSVTSIVTAEQPNVTVNANVGAAHTVGSEALPSTGVTVFSDTGNANIPVSFSTVIISINISISADPGLVYVSDQSANIFYDIESASGVGSVYVLGARSIVTAESPNAVILAEAAPVYLCGTEATVSGSLQLLTNAGTTSIAATFSSVSGGALVASSTSANYVSATSSDILSDSILSTWTGYSLAVGVEALVIAGVENTTIDAEICYAIAVGVTSYSSVGTGINLVTSVSQAYAVGLTPDMIGVPYEMSMTMLVDDMLATYFTVEDFMINTFVPEDEVSHVVSV